MCENYILFFFFFFLEQKYEKFCQKSPKKKVVKCWENGLSPARNTFIGVPLQHLVVMEGSFGQNFKSFLSHVVNKHAGLEDPLFNKCAHGVIEPRKWLKVGMFCSQLCIAYMTVF